ncbi:UDP-glucuronosyltransferase [Aphelenchoides fujianensis]|nr:UDP-glucuronosyltransferase [Aphelenchoides fujianensis]
MNPSSFLLSFLLLWTRGESGRILVGYPNDALSHLYSMQAYLERLANAGHQVTILQTADAVKEVVFSHANVSNLFVRMDAGMDIASFANSFLWTTTSHANQPPTVLVSMDRMLEQLVETRSDALLTLLNTRWDLVVVEQLFNPVMYALAAFHRRVHGTPYIQYSSSHPLESDAVEWAVGRSWAAKQSLFIPIPADSSDVYRPGRFGERLVAFFEHAADFFLHTFAHWWTFAGVRRVIGAPYSMHELNAHSALYMSDLFRGFEAAAEAHDFRLVGAYCRPAKPLPDEFERFVGDPESKGTVYVAFGSIVDWRAAPRPVVRAIFGALNELADYRVIVSTKAPPEGVRLGPHVLLTKWAPQIALLSDARTRLFVSHGGLKSVKEAICGRTPVLYLPLFAEQSHNAREMAKLGIAGLLNKYTLSKATALREMRRLLNDPRFQERATAFNAQFLDHPAPPLDVALHSTERILRRGALGFERKGRRLSWAAFTYAPLLLPLAGLLLLVNRK